MNGEEISLALMTYNIGCGARKHRTEMTPLLAIIGEAKPDLLTLQEVSWLIDHEGHEFSPLTAIRETLGVGFHSHFAPTISLRENLHPGKDVMTAMVWEDACDWQQGNALLSRWPFRRLGAPDQPGKPLNLPLFQPPRYLGNRDTDPRFALIGRVGLEPLHPLLISLHLTTLRFERGPEARSGVAEEAAAMRLEQVKNLLAFLRAAPALRDEIILLSGDFNAMPDEACMSHLFDFGFIRLKPTNYSVGTHPKAALPVDHLLLYPAERLASCDCQIIDTPGAYEASDHLPVLANITLKTKG